jgi:hypothetical protein
MAFSLIIHLEVYYRFHFRFGKRFCLPGGMFLGFGLDEEGKTTLMERIGGMVDIGSGLRWGERGW